MKTKTYIFLFFLIISNFGFGQDSLFVVKEVKSNTTYNYRNRYSLSRIEVDSILNAVYLSEKTQKLLYRYGEIKALNAFNKIKNEDIFLIENHINLVSILSSDSVQSEIKQNLLIEKISYDSRKTPFNPPNNNFCRVFSNSTKAIDINSKDLAITEFIKEVNDEKFLNFSEMLMVFHKINKKGKFIRQDSEVSSSKKIAKIKNAKIKKMEFFPRLSGTAIYGSKGRYGVLFISYDKK